MTSCRDFGQIREQPVGLDGRGREGGDPEVFGNSATRVNSIRATCVRVSARGCVYRCWWGQVYVEILRCVLISLPPLFFFFFLLFFLFFLSVGLYVLCIVCLWMEASPRQNRMHILMSIANKLPCILVLLELFISCVQP